MKTTKFIILGLIFFLLPNMMLGQEADFSLAKVGKRIFGVYVFFGCEPANPYTYVKTIEVKVDWKDSYYDSFEKVIDKAKKKEPNFNGIIFQTENLTKADLIRFNDLESSRGGFSYGSKVSFIDGGKVFAGEIVEIESSRGDATVRFRNIYYEEETKKIDYTKLTPISDEIYAQRQKETEINSENYKFRIGDKVNWIDSNILGQNKRQLSGEIIQIDDKTHKASIKYFDESNKEIITTVSFLDLVKFK